MKPKPSYTKKDRKGRVPPLTAAMKVIAVIESCATPTQYHGARRMVQMFAHVYHEYDLTTIGFDEIQCAMNLKKIQVLKHGIKSTQKNEKDRLD